MKRIFKLLIFLTVSIILTSCVNTSKSDLTDLTKTPKQDSPIIEGSFKLIDIKGDIENESLKIGDSLFINKNLVAIKDHYAFPPSFSSKYVKLSDYLDSRGVKIDKNFEDRNVVVLNASQGQLFSKDFIILNEGEFFLIKDNSLVYFKKFSDKVDDKVIEDYAKIASKERTTTESGEDIAEDISLILGVRERIDPESDRPLYKYYSYLIRIEPDESISYLKAEDIFFKKSDEYRKLTSRLNNITDLYDEIVVYPAKISESVDDEEIISQYSFKDIDLNTRINFVSKDFVSIDYTRSSNDNPIRKYALMETDKISEGHFMTLEEFTGESESDKIFREKVDEEVKKSFPKLDPESVSFDNTNFGIIRNQGYWTFQSSLFTGDGDEFVQNFFNIDIAIGDNLLNPTNSIVTRDQVYNINTQFKDYVVFSNQSYMAIQTPDEILIHRIREGLIEKSPIYAIATRMPCNIISIDQHLGSNAKEVEESFFKYNNIIEK